MRKGLALGLVSAWVVFTSPATAATISFDDTFGPLAVPFPATALATLSLFDPALGTLTKVTLTLDADTSAGSIAFDNEALIATDVTLGIGAEVTAAGLEPADDESVTDPQAVYEVGKGTGQTVDLEIHHQGNIGKVGDDLFEAGNRDPLPPEVIAVATSVSITGIEGSDLVKGVSRDVPGAFGGAIHSVVVHADQYAIAGDVQIRLDVAVSHLDGAGEGLHGVLGPQKPTPPVGNGDGYGPRLWIEGHCPVTVTAGSDCSRRRSRIRAGKGDGS